MGGGGVAVYTEDVEAGPVALIAVGAVFLLVSLRGEWPDKLKAGDNEAAWTAAGQILEDVFDEASAETREEIVDRVSQPDVPPVISAPVLSAAAYERLVIDILREEVERGRASEYLSAVRSPNELADRGYDDAFQYRDGGKLIIVEIKRGLFRGGTVGARRFSDLLDRWLSMQEDTRIDGVLFVTDSLPPAALNTNLGRLHDLAPRLRVVLSVVAGAQDRETLVRALWQVALIPSTGDERF